MTTRKDVSQTFERRIHNFFLSPSFLPGKKSALPLFVRRKKRENMNMRVLRVTHFQVGGCDEIRWERIVSLKLRLVSLQDQQVTRSRQGHCSWAGVYVERRRTKGPTHKRHSSMATKAQSGQMLSLATDKCKPSWYTHLLQGLHFTWWLFHPSSLLSHIIQHWRKYGIHYICLQSYLWALRKLLNPAFGDINNDLYCGTVLKRETSSVHWGFNIERNIYL